MRNFIHYIIGYGTLGYLGWVTYKTVMKFENTKTPDLSSLYTHYYILGGLALFVLIVFMIPVKNRNKS